MLLSVAYAPPVQFFTKLFAPEVGIEACEHFVKQSYRNRCHIAGPQGLIALTIPVESGAAAACPIRRVRISEHGNWRHRHAEALRSSYGSSAFFEHYADTVLPLYERRFTYLWDFNMEFLHALLPLLHLNPRIALTDTFRPYFGENKPTDDYRTAIRPKQPPPDPEFTPEPYYQTFAGRNGFLPNLSILDLLFELGPEARICLRNSAR